MEEYRDKSSSTGTFSESTGINCLGGFFTDDSLLVLSPFIQLHRDISVTFTDVTSAKNKVQLKK